MMSLSIGGESEPPPELTTNWALTSNGSTASASSTFGGFGWTPGRAIDGFRHVNNDNGTYKWRAASMPSVGSPQWLQVTFDEPRSIGRIIVFGYHFSGGTVVPDDDDVFASNQVGIRDCSVQYWDGSSWVTLGSVTDNLLIKKTFDFSLVETEQIRCHITDCEAFAGECSIVELEAWGID